MSGDAKGAHALQRILEEMRHEFPRFRIIYKSESAFQKLIHRALFVVTFGQMRDYLSSYHTTLGQRMYVPDQWRYKDEGDRYIVLAHERVHMRQFRKFTWPGMTLLYLVFPLPMGLAYFRARFEMEAYAESIRKSYEIYGKAHVTDSWYRSSILRQFTGASYGWMWPFPTFMNRWYDKVLAELDDQP